MTIKLAIGILCAAWRRPLKCVGQILLVLCTVDCSLNIAIAQQASIPDSVEKDYASELPRVPPRSPDLALDSFEVLDGFEVSLIACEPLVVDPIAFAFDARERLFVVEMRGYSEQGMEHLGRIALLQDTNGDGRMDRRSTYVQGLSWPTAVWPWKDGVLVAHPPKLTWFRDTDDDGISDTSEDWFVGFGRDNVQGMVNSLRWGVDGYIHGAVSSTGAKLEQVAGGEREKLVLRRRDFAIDPLRKTLQPTSGGGQHGLSFNRWGDKFVTSNSDHLQQVIDLDNWLSQHPSRVALPGLRRSIAEDGPQAEVFRVSPVEPWRIVRTRLRATGVVPGIVEGGGRPAGYFTGATGTWIMDADAGFGDRESDTALVCDVGSNLVHRKRLIDHGLYWSGQRMDEGTELLRSSDIWFRPVQLGDGPGGALVIADMVREVIEHPKSLPPMIKKHLDLTSGRDRGRIWQLKPITADHNKKTSWGPTKTTDARLLSDLSPQELVEQLRSPVAWRRRMASQLLVEQGEGALAPAVAALALGTAKPEIRVLALHMVDRLNGLQPEHLEESFKSNHPRVVATALDLARKHHWGKQFVGSLPPLARRTEPRVQLELAALCADLAPRESLEILRQLVPSVREPLVRSVVAIAAGESSPELLTESSRSRMSADDLEVWLGLLLPVWTESLTQDLAVRSWVKQRLLDFDNPWHRVWLDAASRLSSEQQLNRLLSCLSASDRSHFVDRVEAALETRIDEQSAAWVRLLAPPRQLVWVTRLLEPLRPWLVQREAIRTAASSNDVELQRVVLSAFPSLTPDFQVQALRGLVSRVEGLQALLSAVEAGKVKSSQIPPDVRQQILSSRDAPLARRAERLLGRVSQDREAVIEEYVSGYMQVQRHEQSADALVALSTRGRQHFKRVCAQCHRVDGIGYDVGAALTQLTTKSARQLIEAVLDPNREVDPRYSGYSLLLLDGRVITGVIRDETAGQISMVAAGGEVLNVNRGDIEEIKSSGLSLMPTGIEEQLNPRQLAEVVVFLQTLSKE